MKSATSVRMEKVAALFNPGGPVDQAEDDIRDRNRGNLAGFSLVEKQNMVADWLDRNGFRHLVHWYITIVKMRNSPFRITEKCYKIDPRYGTVAAA